MRAGAREERPDEFGSAHFLEHTLFKGTRTRGIGEADREIENLGGSLNAATGPDAAHFMTTVGSAHLSEALAVLADVVRNATLPDAEVERERGVILDELAEHDADPDAHLLDLLYAAAFDTHPYRRSPGGTPAAIRVRGRDTLAAFYRRTYTPDRCVLALAGDLNPEQAHAAAVHAFGDWQPPASGPTEPRSEEAPLSAPRRRRAYGATSRGRIGLAFRAPAASEVAMACAAQMTAVLLGESHSRGRLAAYTDATSEAAAHYTPRLDPSLFLLTATLPAGASRLDTTSRLNALETALLAALRSLQASPPSPAELAAAKRILLGQAQYERETDAGWARQIGDAEIVRSDTPEAFQQRVAQMTLADLERYFQQYLDPSHRITVLLLPGPNADGSGQ